MSTMPALITGTIWLGHALKGRRFMSGAMSVEGARELSLFSRTNFSAHTPCYQHRLDCHAYNTEDPDYTFPSPLLRYIRPHARLDVMSAPTETTKLFSPSYQSLTKRDQLKFPLGLVPQRVRPYLELIRFEKPTGTILMFWPFAWGLTMAARAAGLPLQEYFPRLLQCLLGAWLVRGSACTVNDIFDRDMDAGVERTRGRPLPSGRISVRAATIYLLVQYALGLAFFYATLDGLAFHVALFQLLPMFMIYPLLKRVSDWPQAWLGFAMNFGFVTAWISTTGSIDCAVLAAAMTGFWSWTMLYDTIYACQDKADDVKVGVRSTALLFGSWIRPLLVALGLLFVTMLALAGYLSGQGIAYYAISVGGTAAHLLWQYFTVNLDEPASCGENFKRNGHLGWIIWGGLFVDYATSVASSAIVAFI